MYSYWLKKYCLFHTVAVGAKLPEQLVYLWGEGRDAVVGDGVVGEVCLLLLRHLEANPLEGFVAGDMVAAHDAADAHLKGGDDGECGGAVGIEA